MFKEKLLKKIEEKSALIAVLGLGYVGLPLCLRFAEVGFHVLGIDIDPEKINHLKQGTSYIKHISSDKIASLKDKISVSSDFSCVAEADALILCIPTPLNPYREPDLSFVIQTIESVRPFLRPGQIVSLESTTYPGTTDEEIKPRIENASLTVGENIFLIYSPEREDPGNPDFETATIPKVCGGYTETCLEIGQKLYGSIVERVVPVGSLRVAEMTKLLENIHRAVNIGLVNEMKILCDKMKIDIHEVIRAAATKPFGFVPYYPGPGIGGHCIPVDPFYLTWKARQYGMHTRFIELAGEINSNMPKWVVNKVSDALNDRGLPLKGSRILILGVAYKPNVDDVRESPSLHLIELLQRKGALVDYADPYVPQLPKMRDHDLALQSVLLNPQTLESYTALILVTDHASFNYDMIHEHAHLIIDTRDRLRHYQSNKVVAA